MEVHERFDSKAVYSQVEDFLVPGLGLDAFDRSLYYHLLRHTRLEGAQSVVFAIAPLAKATGISDIRVREGIRTLHHKGCLRIEERNRLGHLIFVLLPSEVPGLVTSAAPETPVDLLSIDFFTNRIYVQALLERENCACFYCLKALNKDTCELDHVNPQAEVADNSYKNIVIACHGCNKSKGERPAEDFVRSLYRSGILNEQEIQSRLRAIEAVRSGLLVPSVIGAAAN